MGGKGKERENEREKGREKSLFSRNEKEGGYAGEEGWKRADGERVLSVVDQLNP